MLAIMKSVASIISLVVSSAALVLMFTKVADAGITKQHRHFARLQDVAYQSQSLMIPECPLWSYYDAEKQICNHDIYYAVKFKYGRTYLRVGYCMTYDNNTGIVAFSPCPYSQTNALSSRWERFLDNVWYIQIPDNVSELNNYMCGPLNRKGRVCSECDDGYGPGVTSTGFNIQCSNCTDVWYAIPLYLVLEFVPVTVLYLVILIFQINIISAPMTCYIMYSQLVALWWNFAFDGEDYNISKATFRWNSNTDLFRNIVLTLYDVWNLRFFHFLLSPFCISSKLKPFHIGLLGYISVFHPLCLIAVTWISIELHDRNFKPLVWLWRPFHGCFARLRRRVNKKSDIIDVFASFFLLSFSKVMYQADLLWSYQTIRIKHLDDIGNLTRKDFMTNLDLTVPFGSGQQLLYAIPAFLVMLVFNILPTVLLLFYPFAVFKMCLSKCRLDGPRLNEFVEKFYGCYRDGLEAEGGKDMRSFAGLYFVLRPTMFVTSSILSQVYISQMDPYFSRSLILIAASLLIALCRPYRKTYMTVLDALLLAHFAVFCHLISSYQGFYESISQASFVFIFEAMLVLPLVAFILFFVWRGFVLVTRKYNIKLCPNVCKKMFTNVKKSMHVQKSSDEQQLLIDPSREITYEPIDYTA